MRTDPESLRIAMRQWATGVTIVAAGLNGERHGMTVSSFTSVSLDPPLVLVSLERITHTHRLVVAAGYFAVSVLGQGQQEISDRFAGRVPDDEDRFAGLETFQLVSGMPFLAGGLAYFDCQVVSTYPAGTHTVFIGEVLSAQNTGGVEPLVYYNQAYRRLA